MSWISKYHLDGIKSDSTQSNVLAIIITN